MTGPRYLTDAERPLRPAHLQESYCLELRLLIRGHWYVRWFRTETDRDAYQREFQASREGIIDHHAT